MSEIPKKKKKNYFNFIAGNFEFQLENPICRHLIIRVLGLIFCPLEGQIVIGC